MEVLEGLRISANITFLFFRRTVCRGRGLFFLFLSTYFLGTKLQMEPSRVVEVCIAKGLAEKVVLFLFGVGWRN